jgi:D-glycero-alpha-D-manno-heptose 1-phosphate guanylyltransferase
MVKTAIILAGGLGTRLRAMVADVPKPMAPINNRPFLAHQLDYWIAEGIEHFILSIGYKHEIIMDYFKMDYKGAKIDYVIEQSPIGTGGGLLNTIKASKINKPFLLLNGDTYFTVNLTNLINFAELHKSDWTFSLFRNNEKDRYMGISITKDGEILQLNAINNTLFSGGVYWIRNLEMLHNFNYDYKDPISLENDILPNLKDNGFKLFGLEYNAPFIDIGLPHDYHRASSVLITEN